jgi:hypothetical protein
VEEYVRGLISQHSRSGILVDTNVLLLFFVGRYDRELVERFGRTADRFVSRDYDTLVGFLQGFERIVTTPHILTETSNLMGHLSGRAKAGCFALLVRSFETVRETYVPSAELAQRAPDSFGKLGITDTAILEAAAEPYLVLTDDFSLYNRLTSKGLAAVNFNHLRDL